MHTYRPRPARAEVVRVTRPLDEVAMIQCLTCTFEPRHRVARNSPRWNVFMNTFRDLADARAYWLHETARACNNNVAQIYDNFLQDRGLDRP